jgi:hypothetical protein
MNMFVRSHVFVSSRETFPASNVDCNTLSQNTWTLPDSWHVGVVVSARLSAVTWIYWSELGIWVVR